ncbi:hypothetical protein Oter_4416 [Opitutus terrae PB90-1]|uniref:Uncharacterized protein n=1 Tax=Opitutus terrae (strain DSM 11246 / JCM 15787 / PB90-1) TaxID=452637 RepID=B1ZRN9_OPITP|nr:hypothetical protein Oter_4416 [Opitutus terrae PB90-1]
MNCAIFAEGERSSADTRGRWIGFSITNQSGEHFVCRAKGVTMRIERGLVQLVEGHDGCFVWFDRCRVELYDGCRKVCYRLLAGSASRDGARLAILAEVVDDLAGPAGEERSRARGGSENRSARQRRRRLPRERSAGAPNDAPRA